MQTKKAEKKRQDLPEQALQERWNQHIRGYRFQQWGDLQRLRPVSFPAPPRQLVSLEELASTEFPSAFPSPQCLQEVRRWQAAAAKTARLRKSQLKLDPPLPVEHDGETMVIQGGSFRTKSEPVEAASATVAPLPPLPPLW